MTDPDETFEPASRHLQASLAARRGGAVAKAARAAVTVAVGLFLGETEGGPSETDLVVTRRDSGNEVLRVSAGTLAEADRLLARVREDLDDMTVAQFVSEWRIVADEV